MLVEDSTVLDVVRAKGGMRDSLAAGAIHLAMGTYGVATIRTLAAEHAQAKQILVAAPVLGRPDLAASGKLGIVPAGPAEALERCAPLSRSSDAGRSPPATFPKRQRRSNWRIMASSEPP